LKQRVLQPFQQDGVVYPSSNDDGPVEASVSPLLASSRSVLSVVERRRPR